MDTSATLGEYLRTARERARLSQRQLASRVGIHNSYLARLESGENDSPAADVLQTIADVLEIPSTDLLAFIGVKPPEGLPELAPYLRAKYRLGDDEIKRVTTYFRRTTRPRDADTKDNDA